MDDERSRPKVLLVDDEVEFLEATSRVLRRRELEVLTAASGEQALAVLASETVDVVVLDVKMPGMDGDEVFRRVRDEHPGLPVIMLTGHGTVPQAFQMSKDGVHDYLAKPFPPELLAAKVCEAAHRTGAHVDHDAAPGPGEAISVLLVDDEEELLESLKKVLSRRGFRVTTAKSGEWALQLLLSMDVDVVVVDVRMPGMDGLQLLQQIRNSFPDRQVILLTGYPSVETAVTGVKLGAAEYMTKPANVDDLASAIHRAWLERREAVDVGRRRAIDEILDRQPE